jgi:hypothetical protein
VREVRQLISWNFLNFDHADGSVEDVDGVSPGEGDLKRENRVLGL